MDTPISGYWVTSSFANVPKATKESVATPPLQVVLRLLSCQVTSILTPAVSRSYRKTFDSYFCNSLLMFFCKWKKTYRYLLKASKLTIWVLATWHVCSARKWPFVPGPPSSDSQSIHHLSNRAIRTSKCIHLHHVGVIHTEELGPRASTQAWNSATPVNYD